MCSDGLRKRKYCCTLFIWISALSALHKSETKNQKKAWDDGWRQICSAYTVSLRLNRLNRTELQTNDNFFLTLIEREISGKEPASFSLATQDSWNRFHLKCAQKWCNAARASCCCWSSGYPVSLATEEAPRWVSVTPWGRDITGQNTSYPTALSPTLLPPPNNSTRQVRNRFILTAWLV